MQASFPTTYVTGGWLGPLPVADFIRPHFAGSLSSYDSTWRDPESQGMPGEYTACTSQRWAPVQAREVVRARFSARNPEESPLHKDMLREQEDSTGVDAQPRTEGLINHTRLL